MQSCNKDVEVLEEVAETIEFTELAIDGARSAAAGACTPFSRITKKTILDPLATLNAFNEVYTLSSTVTSTPGEVEFNVTVDENYTEDVLYVHQDNTDNFLKIKLAPQDGVLNPNNSTTYTFTICHRASNSFNLLLSLALANQSNERSNIVTEAITIL